MKNTLNFLLLKMISIIFSLQSCEKEKKNEQENFTENKIEKPSDSVKSVFLEKPEKSIRYTTTVEKIDSLQYHSVKKKTSPKNKNFLKITDINEAKKLLRGIVEFDEQKNVGANLIVRKIHFRNGEKYVNNRDFDYFSFIAFYPEEDILLCKDEASSDISFNLKNGKKTEETGNPDLFIFSPKETFRINGVVDGMECMGYFIQKKIDGEYQKIINFEDEFKKKTTITLCNIRDGFWIDEQTFFLEKFDFDYETGKYKFFKIKIVEK